MRNAGQKVKERISYVKDMEPVRLPMQFEKVMVFGFLENNSEEAQFEGVYNNAANQTHLHFERAGKKQKLSLKLFGSTWSDFMREQQLLNVKYLSALGEYRKILAERRELITRINQLASKVRELESGK